MAKRQALGEDDTPKSHGVAINVEDRDEDVRKLEMDSADSANQADDEPEQDDERELVSYWSSQGVNY